MSVKSWGECSGAKTHNGNPARRVGGHVLWTMSKGCQLIRRGPPWRLPGGSKLRLFFQREYTAIKSDKRQIGGGKKKWTVWQCKGEDWGTWKEWVDPFVHPLVFLATLPLLVWSCKKRRFAQTAASQRVSNCSGRTVPNQLHSAAPHGVAQCCTMRMDTTGVPPRCQATVFILRHVSLCETADTTIRLTGHVYTTTVHL